MRTDSGSRTASVSRRRLLAGAAGAGAAVAVAGIAGTESAGTVAAAPPVTAGAKAGRPVVVHLRDVATGAMEVFSGTERIEIRDRTLAERIAAAAANADQIDRSL